MGFIHSNYSSFKRNGILIMPYSSLMTRINSKESLTTRFCKVTIYLYISFNRKLWMSWWHGRRHPQTVTSKKWCYCVQNCTEHPSHTYTMMTVTKTNVTISLTQPNDILLDCQVFRLPFQMAWHYYGS